MSSNASTGQKHAGALQMGPRKKVFVRPLLSPKMVVTWMLFSCGPDPLVHHGRHFGRTVHALCAVNTLIKNGKVQMEMLAEQPDKLLTHE